MNLDFGPVLESAPFVLQGLGMTLFVSVVAMSLALLLGLPIALMRLSAIPTLKLVSAVYVDFFRGLPQLVFLMWVYFGVVVAFGLKLSPLQAAIACLAIQEAAHLAEIYRSGIEAIPREQTEAALSLGLTPLQAFKDVVFAQALRIVTPAIGNDFIGMVKGSALVSILGVYELMRAAQARGNYFFRPFEFLTTAAVIYVVIALGLGAVVSRLETRLAKTSLSEAS